MIGRRLALAGAVLATLSLAACGDSSDPVVPPENPTPGPVAEAAPPAVVTAPAEIAAPTTAAVAPTVPEPPALAVTAPPAAPAPATATPAEAAPVATPAAPAAAPTPPVATPTPPVIALPAAPAPAGGDAAPAAVPPTQELVWLQQPPFTNPAAAAPATTPADPAPAAPAAPAATAPPPAGPAAIAVATADAPAPTLAERLAMANVADGAMYLIQCEICHTVEEGGRTGIGPNLFAIVGAPVARETAFNYSPAFQALAATGATWTPERLDAFLAAPGAEVPGTRMGFGGYDDPDTRANVIAWLATLVPVAADAPPPPQIIGVEMPGLNPLSYLAAQADVGADLYVSLGCGSCHGADMRGGVASALVGPAFEQRWYVRPLIDFFLALRTMPPNDPGTLADARYLELFAAILAANGFYSDATPLRANPAVLQATGFYQAVRQPRNR